jgi:hypothetical protein
MRGCRSGRRLLLAAATALLFGCAGLASGPQGTAGAPIRVVLEAPTATPIQTVNNLTLVYATINERQGALMVVDTGAQRTLLTPVLLRRMNVPVPTDAPRRKLFVVGGQVLEVPIIRIPSVRAGAAVVENLEVGVLDFAPHAPIIDGLLGGDFLSRFKATLDGQARLLRLEPLVR